MQSKKKNGQEPVGLCSTCNNAPCCTLSPETNIPIWECGEYEDSIPASAATAFQGVPVNVDTPYFSPPSPQEGGQLRGLCVNCENWKTCGYEKSEAGVWHCEDYR